MSVHRAVRPSAVPSVALVVCLVGGLGAAAPAVAAPPDPVYPSQEQVDAAREAVAGTAGQVGAIEAELAAASARLERLEVAAGVAAEDYNEAQVALERATQAADAARHAAQAAREEVEAARTEIGRLAASTYRSGTGLAGLEVFLAPGGPQELLDKTAAVEAIGQQRQQAYQRMRASDTVARLLEEQARTARAAQEQSAAEAERARAAAQQAADAAAAEVAAVDARRGELITQLAALRQTSVALETRRQAGLEEERRRREEEAARAEVQRREAEQAARAEQARPGSARPAPTPALTPAPSPAPAPAPAPPPPAAQAPSAPADAGQGAVDWAAAQIGKDYEWGASGPDSFDCSGLTSQAWKNGGGQWITRTSRSQWAAVSKVPYSQLRPGDLIFYATDTSDPSTIWHVAIYAGDGMMIEAPRAGVPVHKAPVRWSNAMPSAGRP